MRDDEDFDDDEKECLGHYEHNYKKVDERDGITTYICSRCGAETQEEESK